RSLGLIGDRLCRRKGLLRPLDPDVAGPFEGLNEGYELPVGRKLSSGDLRISEEEFTIKQRRLALRLNRNRPRQREYQNEGKDRRDGNQPTMQTTLGIHGFQPRF